MKAVILAAGMGRRAAPLTESIPKVLINIGQKPLLWYLVTALKKSGNDEIGIVVGYKKEKIMEFLKKENFSGITLIEQGELRGTAHAVAAAEKFVGREPFIVLMGDSLYSTADVGRALAETGTAVGVTEVSNPHEYGVVITEGDKLKAIIEKPANPPTNLINTALYRFESNIFEEIESIVPIDGGELSLVEAVNKLAAKQYVKTFKVSSGWMDFDSIEEFLDADVKLAGKLMEE
ncbi:MAG: NTP transferase domain-containing protein [Candidatus Aenigmarchaeota archaeon]|nr:NTP transferase domain-containing protein [Candidatus Aenigmarchaeota archaeon]